MFVYIRHLYIMKKNIYLILIFFCSFAFSQYDWTEGELYLKDSTILKGDIKLSKVSKDPGISPREKVSFRKNETAKKTRYNYNEVEKVLFSFGEFVYVKTSRSKSSLFKIIRQGKINLYSREVSYSDAGFGSYVNSITEYYIYKRGDKRAIPLHVTNTNHLRFMYRIEKYLGDCNLVMDYIKINKVSKYSIVELIDMYNNC